MIKVLVDRPRTLTVNDFQGNKSIQGINYKDYLAFLFEDWLTTSCMDYAFEFLKRKYNDIGKRKWFYVEAYTSNFLWSSDWKQTEVTFEGDFLFVPVNNGGSHWCFMIIDCSDKAKVSSYYFDSESGYVKNIDILSQRIPYLKFKDESFLKNAPKVFRVQKATKQNNGYDCGMYVIANAEKTLEIMSKQKNDFTFLDTNLQFNKNLEENLQIVTPVFIRQKRLEYVENIQKQVDEFNLQEERRLQSEI